MGQPTCRIGGDEPVGGLGWAEECSRRRAPCEKTEPYEGTAQQSDVPEECESGCGERKDRRGWARSQRVPVPWEVQLEVL